MFSSYKSKSSHVPLLLMLRHGRRPCRGRVLRLHDHASPLLLLLDQRVDVADLLRVVVLLGRSLDRLLQECSVSTHNSDDILIVTKHVYRVTHQA